MVRGRPKGSKNKPKVTSTRPTVSDMASKRPTMLSQRSRQRGSSSESETTPSWKEAFETFKLSLRNDFEKSIGMLESNLEKAIESLSERVEEIEKRDEDYTNRFLGISKALEKANVTINENAECINNLERHSRRNNFRVVGIKRTENENCSTILQEKVLSKFPNGHEIRIERCHRDGRGVGDKPPHILARCLSFQDKIIIMKSWRTHLKDQQFFIVDDLTRLDLKEKKARSAKVKELYSTGTKLRFVAGKWRDARGKPYPF
ncbi:hypothetical protein BSL78_04120 [Apostichopus japonicus]|uniref:Uncharacterized protein n=1 Tax=Stichopus japonicus TaxID=307972 RepID=A0A2G8LFD2_STIJA|nr:hypothetical protein BSL78_04120 [Apostichopus japonicus]